MNRRLLALGGLVVLALLAGCFGPSEIPEDKLTQDANYTWDTDANASYTLDRSSYQAVFTAPNATTIEVYGSDALGTDQPVNVEALKFRFQNGTVVNASHANLSATLAQKRTKIQLPTTEGQVAYTAPRTGKEFATPVVVSGTQTITLPPSARVGVPLLSQVSPGGSSTSVEDDRMTVRWSERTDGTLRVSFYLQRDLLLFSLLILVVVTLGVGGSIYYLRQIRRLERRREELGLDVDYDDDDPRDQGPPPGMR
ncbi:DUF5803 family protein [Halobacteriales archaeon Cl-PHB]